VFAFFTGWWKLHTKTWRWLSSNIYISSFPIFFTSEKIIKSLKPVGVICIALLEWIHTLHDTHWPLLMTGPQCLVISGQLFAQTGKLCIAHSSRLETSSYQCPTFQPSVPGFSWETFQTGVLSFYLSQVFIYCFFLGRSKNIFHTAPGVLWALINY